MVGRNTETRPITFEPDGVPPSPKMPALGRYSAFLRLAAEGCGAGALLERMAADAAAFVR
jgi:hypothetical protein